ncbi:MAG: VWA domain-containing protein [Bacteroidales bacterium]|nr:VWA domain-containing protein [Bacteroidales bacterium]MBO7567627.1 VWA domain-containing protein [Bacteroidales bacterium]
MFDVQFANKEYLFLLLLIPVFAVMFLLYIHRRRKALKKIGNIKTLKALSPETSTSRPIIRAALVLAAMALLIIAVARPRVGSKLAETTSEGNEIMILLDISNSMRATDMYPSRLENTKNAISNLVRKLSSDRVGLIIFAGSAYVQVPLTTDLKATNIFIKSVTCDMISEQGTAFGEAMSLAMKSFNFDNNLNKAIILVSDGENHEPEPDPILIAKQCAEKGVVVHTIGVGDVRGTTIPVKDGSSDFMKDRAGNIVMTKLDEVSLQKIAEAGGGIYVKASNSNSGLSTVYDEISKMEKGEIMQYAEFDEKFVVPALFALILYVTACFVLKRKNRWIRRMGLFEKSE